MGANKNTDNWNTTIKGPIINVLGDIGDMDMTNLEDLIPQWNMKERIELDSPIENSYYGNSVDINNQYAIIGAYKEDFLSPALANAGKAYIYELGEGRGKDPNRAVDYFDRACDLYQLTSCIHLGDVLLTGDGIVQDEKSAVRLYNFACDQGDMEGCVKVAEMFLVGRGITQNINNARTFFQMACSKNYKRGCEGLSFLQKK